jgi:hypothetical protein
MLCLDHDEEHLESRDRLEGVRPTGRKPQELAGRNAMRNPGDGDVRFAIMSTSAS